MESITALGSIDSGATAGPACGAARESGMARQLRKRPPWLAYVIRLKANPSISLDPRSAYRSEAKRRLRTVGTPVPVAL